MSNLTAAQRYVQNQFSVLPVRTDGTKRPATNWKQYQQRIATEQELSQWFGGDNPHGIGVSCGDISNRLAVLDFDNEAEEYFPLWASEVQQQFPDLCRDPGPTA